MTDNYVSDRVNTRILNEIYHGISTEGSGGVSGDRIRLGYASSTHRFTRSEIVALLLQRYVAPSHSTPESAKSFLFNTSFTNANCLRSLQYPAGYPDQTGWQTWAGNHQGSWYQDSHIYNADAEQPLDNAVWHAPRRESIASDGSTNWHQPVRFYAAATGNTLRHGWNQSNANTGYLWGWDPKDTSAGSDDGNIGAHLGFRHTESNAEAIFWFTKNECFFEAIATQGRTTRRISIGLTGRGLWTVT